MPDVIADLKISIRQLEYEIFKTELMARSMKSVQALTTANGIIRDLLSDLESTREKLRLTEAAQLTAGEGG